MVAGNDPHHGWNPATTVDEDEDFEGDSELPEEHRKVEGATFALEEEKEDGIIPGLP